MKAIAVNSMVNAPLIEDKVALRGVMFYRDEGGYIDNVLSSGTLDHARQRAT